MTGGGGANDFPFPYLPLSSPLPSSSSLAWRGVFRYIAITKSSDAHRNFLYWFKPVYLKTQMLKKKILPNEEPKFRREGHAVILRSVTQGASSVAKCQVFKTDQRFLQVPLKVRKRVSLRDQPPCCIDFPSVERRSGAMNALSHNQMQASDGCGIKEPSGYSCYCVPVSKRVPVINAVNDNALVMRILVKNTDYIFIKALIDAGTGTADFMRERDKQIAELRKQVPSIFK
jgi:hypothetical protein